MNRGAWWLGLALTFLMVGRCPADEGPSEPEIEESRRDTALSGATFDAEKFGRVYDRAAGRDERPLPPETAGTLSGMPEFGSVFGQIVLYLLLIVGAIYGGSYLLKRFSAKTNLHSGGPLKVLARHPLSQKSSLFVVSALDRFLIIGESPQGLTCLCEFDDADENRRLLERWGWEGIKPGEKNLLFGPKTSPFGPALRSHVDEIERELDRMEEVSR